jgi:hypothetical protein
VSDIDSDLARPLVPRDADRGEFGPCTLDVDDEDEFVRVCEYVLDLLFTENETFSGIGAITIYN